jgi:hypothetical protein
MNRDLLLKLELPSNPELLCAVSGAIERLEADPLISRLIRSKTGVWREIS